MIVERVTLPPSKRCTLALGSAPVAARVVPGRLDEFSGRLTQDLELSTFERGRQEGRTQAAEQAAGALERAATELDRAREQASAELSKSATQLALGLARILLRREISQGGYELERIVRESLALSGVGRGACVVHLHPEDAAALTNVAFRAGTTIEADSAVSRGCVQVSTPHGLLVRDHEEALQAIARAWREVTP